MISAAIAARITQVVFWLLLVYGLVRHELTFKRTALFVIVWIAASVFVPRIVYGDGVYVAVVAVLDIALVLMIFKGDVRLL